MIPLLYYLGVLFGGQFGVLGLGLLLDEVLQDAWINTTREIISMKHGQHVILMNAIDAIVLKAVQARRHVHGRKPWLG